MARLIYIEAGEVTALTNISDALDKYEAATEKSLVTIVDLDLEVVYADSRGGLYALPFRLLWNKN